MSAPVLELQGVKRWFGGIRAVDGVNLAVSEGEVVAVIGPNGAGKSTLFALMMGELAPTAGQVLLDGRRLGRLAPERRSRLGIGRTFQTPRLFAGLSVRENVQAALLAAAGPGAAAGAGAGGRHLTGRALRGPRASREGQAEQALCEVGLLADAGRPAAELSQGARKRLELAMVLAGSPRILLLDEPTAGMGADERATIMELVGGAVSRRGLTMVFTEHDMETVFARAQRIVVMDRGTVLADGDPQAIRADPQVQEIYLGRQAAEAPDGP